MSLRLPAGRVVRLLLGLCRRGPAHEPIEVRSGWANYRWEGPDGTVGKVAIRTPEHTEHTEPDELALEALRRAPGEDRSFDELAAILTRLVELDGADGQWRWQRVGELLYGRRSHPERHNPALRGWLALLERGSWELGLGPETAEPQAPRKRRGAKSTRGGRATTRGGRPLVHLERHNRSSATVRLDPAFAAELTAARVPVPAHAFRLTQDDHANPEGNLPTRGTRARVRLVAVLRPLSAQGAGVSLRQLLESDAGVDVERVAKRRHLAQYIDRVLEDFCAAVTTLGAGLAHIPQRARSVLDTAVHLMGPGQPHSAPTSRDRPAPLRAPPLRA